MKRRFFALSSLTYAYKAKDALDLYGIKSKIIRLDGNETKRGCRYGIETDERDRGAARSALIGSGIPFTEP